MQIKNDLLKPTNIASYALTQMDNVGYLRHLTSSERDTFASLAAYLIVSSETRHLSWYLEQPTDPSRNFFNKIRTLYSSLEVSNPETWVSWNDASNSFTVAVPSGIDAIFSPMSDQISTLSQLLVDPAQLSQYNIDIIGLPLGAERSALIRSISQKLGADLGFAVLSSVRVVDHIFCLLMDPHAWDALVAPRTGLTETANKERANSLDMFASYLNSLLMYPHFFMFAAYDHNYRFVTEWASGMVLIDPEVTARLNDVVFPLDILDARGDYAHLLESFGTESNLLPGSKLHTLFREMFFHMGLPDFIDSVKVTPFDPISLLEVSALNDPERSSMMMALPVGSIDLLPKMHNLIQQRAAYTTRAWQMLGFISSLSAYFYNEGPMALLRSVSPTVPFKWHSLIPVGWFPTQAVEFTGTFTSSGIIPLTAGFTADEIHRIRTKLLYSISSGTAFATDMIKRQPAFIFDTEFARDARSTNSREWQGLYPSSLLPGPFISFSSSSDVIQIEAVLESLTNESWLTSIRGLDASGDIARVWATYLGSFALLYRIPEHSRLYKENAEYVIDATQMTDYLVSSNLVVGEGMVYSAAYVDFCNFQLRASEEKKGNIYQKGAIHLRYPDGHKSGYILVPHIVLPKVSDEFRSAKYRGTTRYNYLAADLSIPDKSRIQTITRFVKAPSLMHQRIIPVLIPTIHPSPLVFTKRYVYRHDLVLLQNNPMHDPGLITPDTFGMPLSEVEYAGNNTEMFEKRTKLVKPYLQTFQGDIDTEISEEADETKQLKAIETQYLDSLKQSDEIMSKANLKVDIKTPTLAPLQGEMTSPGERTKQTAGGKHSDSKKKTSAESKDHSSSKHSNKASGSAKLDPSIVLEIADMEPSEASAFLTTKKVPKHLVKEYLLTIS